MTNNKPNVKQSEWTASANYGAFKLCDFMPPEYAFTIQKPDGSLCARIRYNGNVEFGEGVSPDDASRRFFECVGRWFEGMYQRRPAPTGVYAAGKVEKVARALAKHDGWDAWDTATTCSHTLSGNDPDDERGHYMELATAALAALAEGDRDG